MKNISKWASRHPISSRFIIAFCHLLVVINAIFFGILLFVFDWGESKWLLPIIANLFFIAYIFYPKLKKRKNGPRSFYLRQKLHDFSLVVFYSFVITFGVNNFLIQNNKDSTVLQPPTAKLMALKPKLEDQSVNRKKLKLVAKEKIKEIRKQIKVEFRALKKELKQQNDTGGLIVLKIFLTIFTIGIVILLGYFIAALACSISCSGNEGLAAVVLIVGWLGLLWLGFIAIKNIFTQIGKRKSDTKVV